MATDLETGIDQGELAGARPSLKIVGLHIRGLKSIDSLDLPEDGLGWEGPIPDFVMVGGINGSGKSTLLEFLAGAFGPFDRNGLSNKYFPQAEEARIDFRFSWPDVIESEIRFIIGDDAFIERNQQGNWYGFKHEKSGPQAPKEFHWKSVGEISMKLHGVLFDDQTCASGPGVVYFPTEQRTLHAIETAYKSPGKSTDQFQFVNRWKPPKEWNDTLEARLYGVRWDDLNAKEEGRDREANGFKSYSRAFDRFFDGRKQLRWHRGELVVETKSGTNHDLSELSSGEKQVILFMGELLHRWRPGSLILIDEPELHLHESYQTKLWESLVDWQKERGGQVIVATQSGHLFRISDPGIKVLLSARRAR